MPLFLAAALYAKRASTLARRDRPVPVWRQVCFASGLLAIAVALVSPIGHISEELVIAHMGEHLLLGDIATLLLVLGLTGPLLQPILAIPLFDRLQVLAHPAVALPLWALNLFVWHVPALYDAAYGPPRSTALEHTPSLLRLPDADAGLRAAAEAEWFTALEGRLRGIAVRFTGRFSATSRCGRAPSSTRSTRPVSVAGDLTLADQSTAGVVMMVEGTFLALGVLAWVFRGRSGKGWRSSDCLTWRWIGESSDEKGKRAQRAVGGRAGRPARGADRQRQAGAERG